MDREAITVLNAVKIRLYPNAVQKEALSRSFACARWYWNFTLNACIQHYQDTGEALKISVYKGMLPQLKKEYSWLKTDCCFSVLQGIAINLNNAYKNLAYKDLFVCAFPKRIRFAGVAPLFKGRAKFTRFKSKQRQQSLQYPQYIKIVNNGLEVPKIGEIKARLYREIIGQIKTVTISKTASDKDSSSISHKIEEESFPTPVNQELTGEDKEDKILGINLRLKGFAIVNDGEKTTKYTNPKYIVKQEKNLKRKQSKLSRKQRDSTSREKARKLVARVHERISNSRQDSLHKLSRKLVGENQVIIVENLHIKGMVKNHKLVTAISDAGWEKFVDCLDYKLVRQGG